ncbi:hypothetical protein ZIOFF_001193 [Zingiber officinale]|uniref:Uncharacterized protein n=1 Tax=Zingiber officinale TaxID=94328 RepID=A0A8J5IJF8_ZINOF|nr:hypothetical protein ZIOFF_001193 [Zingiber officinale]
MTPTSYRTTGSERGDFEDVIRRACWNTGMWAKYASPEDSQGDFACARSIWERVIDVAYPTLPRRHSGVAFVHQFELRYDDVDRGRSMYERFVVFHPRPSSLIKYAKFEAQCSNITRARAVYERAVDLLSEYEEVDQLFVADPSETSNFVRKLWDIR